MARISLTGIASSKAFFASIFLFKVKLRFIVFVVAKLNKKDRDKMVKVDFFMFINKISSFINNYIFYIKQFYSITFNLLIDFCVLIKTSLSKQFLNEVCFLKWLFYLVSSGLVTLKIEGDA